MLIGILKDFASLALELTLLFIAVSFFISLLQGLIPYERMQKLLSGKNTLLGILMALALAFITPFCSCSTIPVVVNLLHKKIRFGIVMVFLFASPVLDPTILTLMGAMLGMKVAVAYTVITSILSAVIGMLLERLGYESAVKNVVMTGFQEKPASRFSLQAAWTDTLGLMKTVYPYLLAGAAIGSVIHEAVPAEWISGAFGGNGWWLTPLAALVGIPLYIRLSSMIPISQILILKGMALGPVMALMISSAGASLPEVTLLNSIFHRRLVAAFVLSVFSMATLSGLLFYLL